MLYLKSLGQQSAIFPNLAVKNHMILTSDLGSIVNWMGHDCFLIDPPAVVLKNK